MSRVQSILKRLDKALTKFAPPDRQVYTRVVTRTGGDDLIGRPGTTTSVDTLLSPQPMYNRPTRRDIEYLHTPSVVENGVVRAAADYIMLVSPDAITLAQLQDVNTFIALKDSAGNAEVFVIFDVQSTGFAGTDIVFEVALRSAVRP